MTPVRGMVPREGEIYLLRFGNVRDWMRDGMRDQDLVFWSNRKPSELRRSETGAMFVPRGMVRVVLRNATKAIPQMALVENGDAMNPFPGIWNPREGEVT